MSTDVTPHRARRHGKGHDQWTAPGSVRLRSEKELLRAGGSEYGDVIPPEPARLEPTGGPCRHRRRWVAGDTAPDRSGCRDPSKQRGTTGLSGKTDADVA